MLELGKVNRVVAIGKADFDIEYDGVRTFNLRANNTSERDTWVSSLNFLRDIKDKMGDPSNSIRSQSQAAYFNNDSFASSRNSSGSFTGKESWKLSNLDKEAVLGVIEEEHHEIAKQYKETDQELSEMALERKGILSYIEEIPITQRKSRVKYGFLKKSGRGKISIDHKRW